jgi:hypothetical protein
MQAKAVRFTPEHIKTAMSPPPVKPSSEQQKNNAVDAAAKKAKRAQQTADRKRKREELEKQPGYVKPTPKPRVRKVDVVVHKPDDKPEQELGESTDEDDEDFSEQGSLSDSDDGSFESDDSDTPKSKKFRK